LTTLPATLDETYDRILCAIDKEDIEYAIRILNWLAFSMRPLDVDQISEVVAIDPGRDRPFDRNEVLQDPLDVLSICPSLVTIATSEEDSVGERKIVLLAHYSVKEYLISDRCALGRAGRFSMRTVSSNELIAKSCLGYLLQFADMEPITEVKLEESRLAPYAARFWYRHARLGREKDHEINGLIMQLFSGAYLNWIRIHDPDPDPGSYWKCPDLQREKDSIPSPLYYASMVGLTMIVESLLRKGADANAQGGWYNNALRAASSEGHDRIVELLLSKGADVNAQSGPYSNALQTASLKGHDRIVELLLSKGADVNAQSGPYGNALYAASAKGHDRIVELLLSKGADVNAQGGWHGNALQAASFGGHDRIVELLLSKGADDVGNALHAASAKGHDRIVELLLSKGADVNEQGGLYGNALQAASLRGHDRIVELLLCKRSRC
jgi:ankyrin repeat protein